MQKHYIRGQNKKNMTNYHDDFVMSFAWALRADAFRKEQEEAREKDKEELYYDVQEGLIFTKQKCRRLIQQGSNNKIFPIETIEFEMI